MSTQFLRLGHEAPRAELDASAMIERYGADALHAAWLRQHAQAEGVDLDRPPGHWAVVQDEIRRRMPPPELR